MEFKDCKIGTLVKMKGLNSTIGYIYKIDDSDSADKVKVEWGAGISEWENHKDLERLDVADINGFIGGLIETLKMPIKRVISSEEEKEENTRRYNFLVEYLNFNKVKLKGVEFKAVLFALKVMEESYVNKEQCLERVKKAYPAASKILVSKLLTEMGIESMRQKENKEHISNRKKIMSGLDKSYLDKINKEE